MKKKLLLCVVLALLLSVTASASGKSYSTTFEALCNLPEISVTIPATAEVLINPYRLPVTIESDETRAQIISTPSAIENKSEVPLNVTVTAAGTVREGSNLRLVASTTENSGLTSKRAFIYFEIQATSDPNQVSWDPEYDAEKHLIIRASEKIKKNIVTIAQADKAKHFGAFRLTGDCIPAPKGGWTEEDGIDVEIAFTFSPLPVWTEVP